MVKDVEWYFDGLIVYIIEREDVWLNPVIPQVRFTQGGCWG